jgi:hypothetical protein
LTRQGLDAARKQSIGFLDDLVRKIVKISLDRKEHNYQNAVLLDEEGKLSSPEAVNWLEKRYQNAKERYDEAVLFASEQGMSFTRAYFRDKNR